MHDLSRVLVAALMVAGLAACASDPETVDGAGPEHGARRLVPELAARQLRFLAASTTPAEVREEIERFSSMGPRLAGYEGADKAHHYIRARFRQLGLQEVSVDTFQVTVPVDRPFGEVVVTGTRGRQLPAYPLWPNGVRTAAVRPEGISGPLVDGGRGRPQDLEGLPVKDSILLLELTGGYHWLHAASLGARALLFHDAGGVDREAAAQAFLHVPADVPRFWVDDDSAQLIQRRIREEAEGGARPGARVDAGSSWEARPAYNVYGWLPGQDEPVDPERPGDGRRWRDQVVVVQAYYDAMSVVPGLAPGAESAAGITALLEVAEVLARHRPDCTVLLLATSGHFQGLAGMRDFLARHVRPEDAAGDSSGAERIDIDLLLSLDLSSGSDRIMSLDTGTSLVAGREENMRAALEPTARRLGRAVREIFADSLRHVDGTRAAADVPPWVFDSEAASLVGVRSLAVTTADDDRRLWDTPLDRPESVDFVRLARQIETVGAMVLWAGKDPSLFRPLPAHLDDLGFGLDVEVTRAAGGGERPLPGALVAWTQPGLREIGGVRSLLVQRADGRGRVDLGLLRNGEPASLRAYGLQADTGAIEAAPTGPPVVDRVTPPGDGGVRQVRRRTVPATALTVLWPGAGDLATVERVRLHGDPAQTGADHESGTGDLPGGWAATVAYGPAGRRLQFDLVDTAGLRWPLVNAPARWLREPPPRDAEGDSLWVEARGLGYAAEGGRLHAAPLALARDAWVTHEAGMRRMAGYGVRSDALATAHEEARSLWLEAAAALDAGRVAAAADGVGAARRRQAEAWTDVSASSGSSLYGLLHRLVDLLP